MSYACAFGDDGPCHRVHRITHDTPSSGYCVKDAPNTPDMTQLLYIVLSIKRSYSISGKKASPVEGDSDPNWQRWQTARESGMAI